MIFGLVTLVLGVVPALLFIRRSPEEMGLLPDGSEEPVASRVKQNRAATDATTNQDLEWTRAEAMRTRTFWLLVITFGIASVGVTGLNLHVYPYVTDLGHPPLVAATVMSVIASMQLFSPLAWGFLPSVDVRIAAMLRFVIPRDRSWLGYVDAESFLSLCGIFSVWHRSWRQHGSAGSLVGELFRPAVSR